MRHLNKFFENKISKEDLTNIFIDIMDAGLKVDIVDFLWTQEIDIYVEHDRLGHYSTFMNHEVEGEEQEGGIGENINELFDGSNKFKGVLDTMMGGIRKKALMDTNPINWTDIKDDLETSIGRLKEFGEFVKIKIFHRDIGFLYSKEYYEIPEEVNGVNVCSGIKIYIGSEKDIPSNKPGLINKFKEFFGKSRISENLDHLKDRGIEENKTRFIYDEKSGDTFFFLYNLSGQMVGYQKYNPAYPKNQPQTVDPRLNKYFTWVGEEGSHKKIAVWGLETINFGDRYIFLTEGIFDCARIHRAGEPGIATLCNDPSTSMQNWLMALPQKKIVIYDNDSAGRKLKKVGDFCFTVPAPYKDLGEMSQEKATQFIKFIKDQVLKKKINESRHLSPEERKRRIDLTYSNWDKISAEIKEISFILNDIGFDIELWDPSIGLILPPKLFISPYFGSLIGKNKISEFIPNYDEFIDRCSEICEKYGCILHPTQPRDEIHIVPLRFEIRKVII